MANNVCFLNVDCVGESSGRRYVGEFEVKTFLTLKDKGEAARLRNKYLKDIRPDDDMFVIMQLVANLKAHIVKSPKWWGDDGSELVDSQPLISLAEALREAQKAEIEANNPSEKEEVSDEA